MGNVQINNHGRNPISRKHSLLNVDVAGKKLHPPKRMSKKYVSKASKTQPFSSTWRRSNEQVDHDSQQRQSNDRIGYRLRPDRRRGALQGDDIDRERRGHGDETDGRYEKVREDAGREEGESREEGDDHDDAERAVGVAAGDLRWVVHLGE